MAYIKSSVPFMGPLVVITDCAIYSYLHESIPISELCCYAVTQADVKSTVILSNARGSQDILGGTFITKNVAGMELVQFIRELQRGLLRDYTWARQQRDTMAEEILAAARSEMQAGRIPAERIMLLDALALEDNYCNSVVALKAEDIFRTFDRTAYQEFLNHLPVAASGIRSTLNSNQELFSGNFIRDLSNLDLTFDSNFLSTVYSNLSMYTEFSESHCLILTYICARLDKHEQFSRGREQVRRRLGDVKAQELDFFKGRYCNLRMKRVYDVIKDGAMPPEEWLSWTDSIGLTPLHYAIILHQEYVVEQMLEKRSWQLNLADQADDVADILDYTVLACYMGLSNRADVFQKTSELVAAQLRSRKALERRLFIKKRKLDLQSATEKREREILRQARHNRDIPADKIYDLQEKLENVAELKSETLEEIDEINQTISDIDCEIQELTEDALINAADTIQRLRGSPNPLLQYLFRLFSDPVLFLHVLSGSQERCRLYTSDGFSFVTPADVNIDLPYCEEYTETQEGSSHAEHTTDQNFHESQGQQQDAGGPIKRPYGESWFSPEAHHDMKKLKEEYHRLAKQYHPDKCAHPRSKQIFQEILNERASILESMN